MMIIQIDRSRNGEQTKLLSDECYRIIGIRQETHRAREILYVHTALRWEGADEGLPENPLQVTDNLDNAIKALREAGEYIRREVQPEPGRMFGGRTLQLGALYAAGERLKAIQAPEMQMKAGKWFAVTETTDRRRRLARAAKTGQAPTGFALAMRVLQSDLYAQLDDIERGECDALIAAGQQALKVQDEATAKEASNGGKA